MTAPETEGVGILKLDSVEAVGAGGEWMRKGVEEEEPDEFCETTVKVYCPPAGRSMMVAELFVSPLSMTIAPGTGFPLKSRKI